jgi:hypothetical protein
MQRRQMLLVAPAVLAAGCAATPPYWTMTDGMNRLARSKSFEFQVAEGWMRTTEARAYEQVEIDGKTQPMLFESMQLTRDGARLHAITVTRRYPDNAFPALKRKSREDMLPPEAADLYVSELKKRSGMEKIAVLSNKPAKIDGKNGFVVLLQFKNEDGLRINIMTHGFVDKTGFYTLAYRAPALHFHERDLRAYLDTVTSWRQTKAAFEPPPELPGWVRLFT